MGEQAKKKFIIDVVFLLLWATIIIIAGKFLLQYLLPFVISIAVAALMQRPADLLSKKIRIKKGVCAALLSAVLYIFLATVLIFTIFRVFSFTGSAVSSLKGFGQAAADVFLRLETVLGRILTDISPNFKDTSRQMLTSVLENILEKASETLSNTAASIVKTAPAFLFSSVVALAATCYIAKDFDGLKQFTKNLVSEKAVRKAVIIKEIFKSSVVKIVGGYLLLMLLTFLELAAGFLILGVKSWFLIALIIAVIDVLPVLGVGVVLLPWGIINIILGNSFLGIGLMLLYLLVTIIRNFVEPKIVGSTMGINPLFILFTMFLGLRVFGFFGLLILPVTFIVVVKYYKNEMQMEASQ